MLRLPALALCALLAAPAALADVTGRASVNSGLAVFAAACYLSM
jgi:hypothetical protein